MRAVVWLAETGKAVLKLTGRDYAEHHLTSAARPVTARAGAVNGESSTRLGDEDPGPFKLPERKRIVVFSPHPDDDVISMGGILRKLIPNENEIVVAYMTSGNIAVFDHDVRRHLDFLDGRRGARAWSPAEAEPRRLGWKRRSRRARPPATWTSDEVQTLKRMIRESEAVAAIESLGLPRPPPVSWTFLSIGPAGCGRLPIGEEDVAIVANCSRTRSPEYVFVAGDLSDPHGTHRMCQEAIEPGTGAVMARQRPEVWLYRGAWQEWDR